MGTQPSLVPATWPAFSSVRTSDCPTPREARPTQLLCPFYRRGNQGQGTERLAKVMWEIWALEATESHSTGLSSDPRSLVTSLRGAS